MTNSSRRPRARTPSARNATDTLQVLAGVVPVCVEAGRVYGVEEWFLPALAALLDEARTVALLRCLRAEANTAKVRRVLRQLLEAGKQAAAIVLTNYPAKSPPA